MGRVFYHNFYHFRNNCPGKANRWSF